MIIDAHAHVFPDAIAPQAVAAVLSCGNMTAHSDGTRAGLAAALRRAGIALAINLPVATTPEQVAAINRWAVANNAPPIHSLAAIHPDSPAPAAILGAARTAGLRGIKLHPEYQSFDPLEARLTPIWAACVDLGMTVVFHSGYDAAFPPPFRSSPAQFATLAQRWPELRMVLAHCGGLDDWREVPAIIGPFPRIAIDLAYSFASVPPVGMTDLIRRLGAERVFFGTDTPWRDPAAELAAFMALPLSPSERELILWRNAADLLGLES